MIVMKNGPWGYLRRHWRLLLLLVWGILVYVAYVRQFVPHWDSIRDMLDKLAGIA